MNARHRRRPPAKLVLGPILHARGTQGDRWRVSACVLMGGEEEPPDLKVEGVSLPVPPRFLHDWGHVDRSTGPLSLWRYDFAVPRGPLDGRAGYGFLYQDAAWHFAVPGTSSPLRLAHVNGAAQEGEDSRPLPGHPRNARWSHLLGSHRASPLHMLLSGGPQVEAGGLWQHIPALRKLADLTTARRAGAAVPEDLSLQLDVWFLASYRYAWSQAEPAALLASVPLFAGWDEGDIFPGWAGLTDGERMSPLYRAIFGSAARAARLFQLGMADDDAPDCVWGAAVEGPADHSQGLVVDGTGLLIFDLLSARGDGRLLSSGTFAALPHWLDRFRDCRHLLVLASEPPAFPSPGLMDRVIGALPGRGRSEGPVGSAWRRTAMAAQWEGLIRLLAGFARETRCHVTILSGALGVAGRGSIRGLGLEIDQLLIPPLVQPPPADADLRVLERMAARGDQLPGGLTLDLTGWPGAGRHLLPARGWLGVTLNAGGGLAADWHLEGEPAPR